MSSGVGGGGSLGIPRLGRYQLLRKIAVGGMAELYLARMSGLGGFEKNVVVKRILPQLAESDEFFAMFLDEARIAATLSHPNVVQIYDAGQAGTDFFIAMEYLDGADLHTVRRVLAERGREFPIEHAIFIVSSVASGLHYAHERLGLDGQPLHIVHRDVTPHNVFLTREGGVKLVDFGIAKATNRMSHTSCGTLKGKLTYMSPEQCRGEQVDRRSDIYSMGILLYELTTGRRLYGGKSEYELLTEIVEGSVPPPSHARPDYPGDLEAIVMRTLARDRGARFPNALSLVQELERFARRHAVVGSTAALAEFLSPLLEEAQRQIEARQRLYMKSALPAVGPGWVEAADPEEPLGRGERDGDRQETVAEIPGRRHERLSSPRMGAVGAGHVLAARRSPTATPLPERVRWSTTLAPETSIPEFVPERPRSLPRPTLLAVLALLLVVAGGGAAALHHRDQAARADEVPTMMKAAAKDPRKDVRSETGALSVTSEPPGAAVWLNLGPAPAVSGPVDSGRPHWIRIEHEGYRPRTLLVDPTGFRTSDQGNVAEVETELEPAGPDPDDSPLPEPTALPSAAPTQALAAGSGGVADAQIRVSTNPSLATVWLLVGVTPARVAPLTRAGPHELRLAKDGHLPAFITVGPERFGDDGDARASATLVPIARR